MKRNLYSILLAIGLAGSAYGDTVHLNFNPPHEMAERRAKGFVMPKVPSGFYGVLGHGLRFNVKLPNGTPITGKELAAWIRHDPRYVKGMPIYLLCCDTGSGKTCLAQDLAREMGVEVHAPDTTLWVFEDGSHIVAKSKFFKHEPNKEKMGRMVKFNP